VAVHLRVIFRILRNFLKTLPGKNRDPVTITACDFVIVTAFSDQRALCIGFRNIRRVLVSIQDNR